MKKIMRWFAGMTIGGAAGVVVGILLSPLADRWGARAVIRQAWRTARLAGQQRRAELEEEYRQMQKQTDLPDKESS